MRARPRFFRNAEQTDNSIHSEAWKEGRGAVEEEGGGEGIWSLTVERHGRELVGSIASSARTCSDQTAQLEQLL